MSDKVKKYVHLPYLFIFWIVVYFKRKNAKKRRKNKNMEAPAGEHTINCKHGRFFDRSAYVQLMEDVESGKVGIVIMKDMTRWGRD